MGEFTPTTLPPPGDRPHLKICGLTRVEDASLAIELGASFLGLILTEKSPRHLPIAQAVELVGHLRQSHPDSHLRFFGVFVNEPAEVMLEAMDRLQLSALQVHGDVAALPAPRVVPALRIRDKEGVAAIDGLNADHPAVLCDAFNEGLHGGTGKTFDHRLVAPYFTRRRIFIAGGLNPENISGIVRNLRAESSLPYAFDLSSGVEASPGVKDLDKLRAFFRNYAEAFE